MALPSQYIRVDSALGANEKLLDIDDALYLEAAGLYVLILGRCDIGNTDGVLTVRAIVGVRGIAPGRTDLLDALVGAKMLRRRGDSVTVPDYLDWQRSATEKLSASERARIAARAKHSKRHASTDAETDTVTDASTHADTDAEHLEHLEHREQRERDGARADFEKLWKTYPFHKYRAAALVAFDAFDGDNNALIAAAASVPRDHKQSLRFFIEDGTWRDYLPKTKRPKCDVCGGAGVVLDGDVARQCPECGAS